MIESFEAHIDFDFDCFYKELQSHEYKKYSDCPSYAGLKATIDSVNILRKHMGWERLNIRKMVKEKELRQ